MAFRNHRAKGPSYITCFHPEFDHIYCEIKVDWEYESEETVMYYEDGSGHPGGEELNYGKCEVVSYCDRHVTNEEDKICPDWIDWDYVEEEIRKEINDD